MYEKAGYNGYSHIMKTVALKRKNSGSVFSLCEKIYSLQKKNSLNDLMEY